MAISYGMTQKAVLLQSGEMVAAEVIVDERSFSQDHFDEALAGDLPIFVNMTADWCITCKVNEKLVLSSNDVRTAFRDNDVIYFKGDWTNRDVKIARFLESYGRNGVPLYLYYGARDEVSGKRPEVVILSQILTVKAVKDSLGAGKAN